MEKKKVFISLPMSGKREKEIHIKRDTDKKRYR